MAMAAALTVVLGFAPTYYLRAVASVESLPLRLHVHGMLFTGWMLVFVTQTWLVSTKRLNLHRRLGVLGGLLVLPMLASAVMVAVAWAGDESSAAVGALASQSRFVVVAIPLTSVLLFAILASLGLWYRRRPDVHKRLMMLATIALLPPALGRIPVLAARGPAAFFGVTLLFIGAVAAYDCWTRGRVHPASLWGGLGLAASFPGRVALGNTEAWQSFARWLSA
jgi:hypothetical protein